MQATAQLPYDKQTWWWINVILPAQTSPHLPCVPPEGVEALWMRLTPSPTLVTLHTSSSVWFTVLLGVTTANELIT